jgi:type VI protein secretion system component VasF
MYPLHALPFLDPNSLRPEPETPDRTRRSERGEGVISTAIAVLIIAFLGVAMWVGFNSIFQDATDSTRTQVEQIGR